MPQSAIPPQLTQLTALLDQQTRRYRELNGGRHVGEYLVRPRTREDEELLTEPILAAIIERVLGFAPDSYFPQLGRSGLKPDFTPIDLVAHRFVLDAKSSTKELASHERQIRAYIDQRHLDYGVLFNLRELRVYRRGAVGHDPHLSFDVGLLWQVAHGEALDIDEVDRFRRFCDLFGHRSMGRAEKIARVAEADPWRERAGAGERLEIDLEFLVSQLRALSRLLAEDAAAQHDRLLADVDLNPDRERRLLLELETLAREIEPRVDVTSLPISVTKYRDADGVAGRAWAQYLMRVSQLTLTRIVLYRSWEDAGFVEDCLYDGGFEQVYDRLDRNLKRVLDEAFQRGRARYPWLFGEDNNYDWFRPRDDALVDVLYALVPFPLARLGADVLGGLYESYVDEIDRDRLGQFYTPRSVVRFMLDRAGFAGAEGIFRLEADERHENAIFDFATGSGGFLVEAARRVIDDGGLDLTDPRDLREGLRAIVRGFHGCEISPFPYYLTEINLLLQVSRLLGRLREAGEEPGTFTLGVVHTDSLGSQAWIRRQLPCAAGRPPSRCCAAGVRRALRNRAARRCEAAAVRGDQGERDLRPRHRQPTLRVRVWQQGALRSPARTSRLARRLPRQERLPLLLPRDGGREGCSGWPAVRDHAGGLDECRKTPIGCASVSRRPCASTSCSSSEACASLRPSARSATCAPA